MKVPGVWCNGEQTVITNCDRRVRKRCPYCSRYILVREHWSWNGREFIGYVIPEHKTKPRTYKRPKGDRKGARARRG